MVHQVHSNIVEKFAGLLSLDIVLLSQTEEAGQYNLREYLNHQILQQKAFHKFAISILANPRLLLHLLETVITNLHNIGDLRDQKLKIHNMVQNSFSVLPLHSFSKADTIASDQSTKWDCYCFDFGVVVVFVD